MTAKGTILVVDDESESLALLVDILAEQGYRVRPANSGKLALASAAAEPPDMIVLDMRMPGMDGFEVCPRLKASKKSREIPIIFISGSTEAEERLEGLVLGAVDFVSKPFRSEELLARVRNHLELSRLRTQLEMQVAQRTAELNATVEQLQLEVAERRRAETALRESEERFRNMADTAPVMIWVSGPGKLCTFFNQGYLTFTGRAMDQVLGNGWTSVVHPDDSDRCYTNYCSAFDARRAYRAECRFLRADGEYRWVLATGTPRFESSGVFMGFIGSCLDITDLKRAHEEDLTKQKLETVGALASGIAHDFNNLLGGVLAHSELALDELASGENPMEEMQIIREAATRGAEIVRQLMVYAGEETQVLELVDISQIVKDMLELLKVSVSKHVRVETDLSKQLRAVPASPSQIQQIVMNLFYNASDAVGDRDGVIRVATAPVTAGSGSFLVTSERILPGDYVQLEVTDTGRGMTPDVQARIFDPFFTTKATGSHGHGLVVVKRIVERHHGTIRVSSVPGKGTTFQILLPCSEQMVEMTHRAAVAEEEEALASRGATILVVEDEQVLRQAVSLMLRKKGLSVLEATDGSAALETIRARKDDIDVLLLDITLPGASSREVYEELKRLIPGVPVIVTSAHGEKMAAAALGTEVERFLRKPFRLGDLTNAIRDALSS